MSDEKQLQQPSPQQECFPWHKLDDLILFCMMIFLIGLMSWLNHWDLVDRLTNQLFGAIFMYMKGQIK